MWVASQKRPLILNSVPLLRTYGNVEQAYVVRYKRRVKSAEYGFVEMGSREDALRAIAALDGAMFEENRLRVFLTAPPA